MTAADWRSDPAWQLVEYDRAFYEGREPPAKPTAEAELASPDLWASLYEGNRIVATWVRLDSPSSDAHGTIAVT